MHKKTLIKIFATTGILGGIGAAIGVPASLVKPTKKYEVSLKSKTNSRYLVTVMNNQQNKPDFASKNIFDIIDNDENKNLVSKDLEINKNDVIATINNDNKSKYEDGLEKLIYDLIRAEKNGPKLVLSLDKNSVTFNEKFLNMKYSTVPEKNAKSDIIKTKLEELFFNAPADKKISIFILVNKKVVKFQQNHLDLAIDKIKVK